MTHDISHIDSLIFDMDGTLWNATESYAKVWNATCHEFDMEADFKGSDLEHFMGMSIESIMEHLLGNNMIVDRSAFLSLLGKKEEEMMPTLGGVLYPGVKDALERLHGNFRLFMLSNCSPRGLVNFVNYTGTAHFFDGLLTQGERQVSKSENLRYMASKYSLKCPVYVSDTHADCDQAHEAGMLFVHADWGFGCCNNADWRFATIRDFACYFLNSETITI